MQPYYIYKIGLFHWKFCYIFVHVDTEFAMHVVNPFISENFDKIHLYFRFVLLLQKGTQTEENVEENIQTPLYGQDFANKNMWYSLATSHAESY